MSNLGEKCHRKLWFLKNKPETVEPLSGATRLKFLYGDIIEQLVLFLAKLAGHSVTREQDEVSIGPVKGHIDGVVDDTLVDVKSASTYSFSKFQSKLTPETDAFGYLTQLGSYRRATGISKGAFVAVDKTLGHICVDKHYEEDKTDYEELINQAQRATNLPEPPERYYRPEPDGKSGNEKLGTNCSYCPVKKACWMDANGGKGLRAFSYSSGPRFLTQVMRQPDVPEIPT